MKDNFHDRLEEMLWDYHSELWSIKQQDDYMSQMDTANDIQKIIDELATALTHLIETEKKKARIEELKDMLESDNDPTQCVHCEILSRLLELQGEV